MAGPGAAPRERNSIYHNDLRHSQKTQKNKSTMLEIRSPFCYHLAMDYLVVRSGGAPIICSTIEEAEDLADYLGDRFIRIDTMRSDSWRDYRDSMIDEGDDFLD